MARPSCRVGRTGPVNGPAAVPRASPREMVAGGAERPAHRIRLTGRLLHSAVRRRVASLAGRNEPAIERALELRAGVVARSHEGAGFHVGDWDVTVERSERSDQQQNNGCDRPK